MDSILRQGSKGNAVSELQQLLQNKGFYTGKIDGDFGQGTLNAVLKFQKDNGLLADGIVGNSSWAALRAASKPETNPTSVTTSVNALPTLLPGSKGAAVTQAQQLLKAKGYYQGRLDGDFGAGTRDAIAAFQRANGLTVDGKVGEKTWQKLQAPAIADATPQPSVIQTPVTPIPVTPIPVATVDIGSPPTSTPVNPITPTTSIPMATPSSIFVPTTGTTTSSTTSSGSSTSSGSTSSSTTSFSSSTNTTSSIPASAISLVDAANSYSRARLSNQTTAINNLQAGIAAEVLQQFFERWQTASGQVSSSLSDAFSSYNAAQMSNQNLALRWLQNQLLPQTLDKFRQDWANLNAGGGIPTVVGTPFKPEPEPQPVATATNILQLISLTEAVKVFDRATYPKQVTALENLQAAIPDQTMQQFFQRWTVASKQNAIAISLVDVFQDYADYDFPDQLTALQWLEKSLTSVQIEQFSRDWQA
jgi:peptidoglycan hydrolase-like protein with peptidoglycan-binding domain